VIPRIQVTAYLKQGVGAPSEYISALAREIYRIQFQSAGQVRYAPNDASTVLGEYIENMALLQFHISVAMQQTSQPELYSLIARSASKGLTPQALTFMRDRIASLPAVGSLHKLLVEMFPIVKLANGYIISPVEPDYDDLVALMDRVLAIYNASEETMALISNALKPYGVTGINTAGYDHLCGLTQTAEKHYSIPTLNQLTKLGWPYMWSSVDLSGLGVVIDPSLHFPSAYISESTVNENLIRLAINHASLSYNGGRITPGRSNNPVVFSLLPESTTEPVSPAAGNEGSQVKRKGGRK